MKTSGESGRAGQRGMVAILMAIALVGIIGMASFAIDLGSALVTKAELQNVSDAATLAGTRELATIYKTLSPTTSFKEYTLTSGETAQITAKAASLAAANKAGGISISVTESDTILGTVDSASGVITPSVKGVRGVKITARRDDSANGTVPTMLATVLGINEIAVNATSAAALTPLGKLHKGKGEIPIAIASHWFDAGSCAAGDNSIKFYPTGSLEGCAGWHTFEDDPPTAKKLEKILKGIQAGTFESPETTAGQTYYNFTGGTVASAYPDMKNLYNSKKNGNGDWFANVPVYKASDCSNPNQAQLIIGFAKARIYNVGTAPKLVINAEVNCGIVDDSGAGDVGEGGGENDYGVLVSSPDMMY